MKNNDNMQQEKNENNNIENNNNIKNSFFRKLWYSIVKIEKYPQMASEGVSKALSYLAKIVIILSLVLCLGMMYQTYNMVKQGVDFLENKFVDFSYKDGILDIQNDEPIIIEESNSVLGKTVIDTKQEDEQKINEYVTSIGENNGGIIILKDRAIIKNQSVTGTIIYNYKDSFNQMGLTEFTKQDVINYANSSQIYTLYLAIFIMIFVYAFIMYLITTLWNIVMISIFGYITTWLARIKMRYAAVFNMSVYAITLSVLLNAIYIAINIFTQFYITYFQVMYVCVAVIYLVAAIFIIKSEFIKKQIELMKIIEVQKNVKHEIEEQNKEEHKKDKDKDKSGDEKNEKKQDKEDSKGEPEGSQA